MKTEDSDRGYAAFWSLWKNILACGWVVVFQVTKKGSWVITGKDHGLQLSADWQ